MGRRRHRLDLGRLAVYGFALFLILGALDLIPSTINLDLWLAVGVASSLYLWVQVASKLRGVNRSLSRVGERLARLERGARSMRAELKEFSRIKEQVDRLEGELRQSKEASGQPPT